MRAGKSQENIQHPKKINTNKAENLPNQVKSQVCSCGTKVCHNWNSLEEKQVQNHQQYSSKKVTDKTKRLSGLQDGTKTYQNWSSQGIKADKVLQVLGNQILNKTSTNQMDTTQDVHNIQWTYKSRSTNIK